MGPALEPGPCRVAGGAASRVAAGAVLPRRVRFAWPRWPRSPSRTRQRSMPSCSGRPWRRCARSPPTRVTSAPRSVWSRICTLGGRTCIITPTSIASLADCRSMARVGSPVGQASSCRCACSRVSSCGCWREAQPELDASTLGFYGDLASLVASSAVCRSTHVRVVATRCCHSDLSRAPLDRARPAT